MLCKYWKDKLHEHHKELVYLLDELLNQDGITRDTYQEVNNLLSHSVGDGIEDEKMDDETDLEGKISDTVEYLVQHERI